MTVIRLTIAYDGTRFRGWAAQPGLRTVQGELEAALERILREPVSLTVAGRTDAGVHAWGQVASFAPPADPPPDVSYRLNAVLADDVAVLAAEPAPEGFDARRDARSRTYCYRVLASPAPSPFKRGQALWWPHRLDRKLLHRCASAVAGTHDFTAFTPTDTEHVRFERDVLRCEWLSSPVTPFGRPCSDPAAPGRAAEDAAGMSVMLELWIEADAFMRHMVRVLVGTMLEVASGKRSLEDFESLLAGASRERAGETAPAHGLYLASVHY